MDPHPSTNKPGTSIKIQDFLTRNKGSTVFTPAIILLTCKLVLNCVKTELMREEPNMSDSQELAVTQSAQGVIIHHDREVCSR